jgi:hypothetical protein
MKIKLFISNNVKQYVNSFDYLKVDKDKEIKERERKRGEGKFIFLLKTLSTLLFSIPL